MKITLSPDVLYWARLRARLSTSDLAAKMSLNEESILEWERSGNLTYAQAEKLSTVARVAFGYLFLPNPPVERLPVPDFRTVEGRGIESFSPELLNTVNSALRRQDWYREFARQRDIQATFVGTLTLSVPVETAAKQIQSFVAWDTSVRAKASTWTLALSRQIESVEAIGALVMRSGVLGNSSRRALDVDEFRGFALSDPYAPLIFLNGRDAKAAQMFTLAHELVHLFLGISGVTNLKNTYAPDIESEHFCNAVAAELLVPLAEIKAQWEIERGSPDFLMRLVRHFKVSSLVILRRLRDASVLEEPVFRRLYANELAKEGKLSPKSGGDPYRTTLSRLGKRFVAAVVESALEGRTLYRDAFQLLGVSNSEILRKLAQTIEVAA